MGGRRKRGGTRRLRGGTRSNSALLCVSSALLRVKNMHITVVLAMSVDGKIADFTRAPARFGSVSDRSHLERQVAAADVVLFGAGTLRAYGTTLTITNRELLQQRQLLGKRAQPIHVVVSNSGRIDPQIRFFSQPVRRWLLTTIAGAVFWQEGVEFERVLVRDGVDLAGVLGEMPGDTRMVVLGGGELVASMLDLIDEFWLTVCPLILGGVSPTPVGGDGFMANLAPRLELIEVLTIEDEVFLHYRRQRE